MQVYKIAKATGKANHEVAADLGVEISASVHLASVDDVAANAYINANKGDEQVDEVQADAVEPEAPEVAEEIAEVKPVAKARFWSRVKAHYLQSSPAERRGDIQFNDWVYETDEGSVEADWLRKTAVRDRIGIRELKPERYDDPEVNIAFRQYLWGLIHTGHDRTDPPSREGRDSVVAMLTKDEQADLTIVERNSPKDLIARVGSSVSFNVQAFETGVQ